LAELVAGLLGSHTGSCPHKIKNSTEFGHTLGSLHARLQDIMVTFDVSLFIWVPIRKIMSLLSRHFEDILRLFCHVLMASYFNFAGQYYEQIDGVAMGSPLFLVIDSFHHLATETQTG
jgi:hypothetical protein